MNVTMRIALLFAALGSLACASARHPVSTPTPRAATPVAASRDGVWSAALRVLGDRSLPVRNSDKPSGILTTEEVTLPAADSRQAGECARGAGMTARPSRAQYSILVAGDSAVTLRVSTRLTWYNMYGGLLGECTSSGFLEQRLEQAIQAAVTQP